MRGMQVKSDPMRVLRSVEAAAQSHSLLELGSTEQAKHSKLRSHRTSALGGQGATTPEELQDVLWKHLFADTAQWWDNRRSKPTPRHPDFRHKESKLPLWLNSQFKPAWVDSELAKMDAAVTTTSESAHPTGPGSAAPSDGYLELRICRKLCEDGLISDAVDALHLLVHRGCHVPSTLFFRVLKRCIQDKDLRSGTRIHALTVQSGYQGDSFLATQLIGLYASQGHLDEAMGVFTEVPAPNAYNWATIIFAYARHGDIAHAAKAIRLYRKMRESTTIKSDDRLYSAILKACAAAKDLVAGKEVHSHILASSRDPDTFVQTGLVNMYAKCGSLDDARALFDKLVVRNVVAWNAMIAGYAQQGMGREAFTLYRSMRQEALASPDSVTYVCLLQACVSVGVGALHEGKRLHAEIQKRRLDRDLLVARCLVNMYAKCGSLRDARRLFDNLPERNIVAWNAMIAGYAQQGMGHEALRFYRVMQHQGLASPDFVTYVSLLQACASVGAGALDQGKQLHVEIQHRGLHDNLVIGRSLVNMYAKCGNLDDATRLFDKLPDRNILAWNAMIAGFAQQGMGQEALSLYRRMHQEGLTCPDSVTYVSLLQACASVGMGALDEAKLLHAEIIQRGLLEDEVLASSLVDMYVKFGMLVDARAAFDNLLTKGVVTWTTMIAGYAQHGMGQEALGLYNSMQQQGPTPDAVTYVCLLQACATVAALPVGEQLHAEIEEKGMQADGVVGAALVHMYAKCGSMHDAQRVFDSLSDKPTEAWDVLISGYARQGNSQVVFNLLDRMRQEGKHPNDQTFLSVLTVCSHTGLVDRGRRCFEVMMTEYGISATEEHYMCMVDLLGRAGHLDEALHMAKTMPFPPNAAVWRTLLSASRKWKNVKIGQQAFEGVVSVDAKDAAAYVLMSSIYSSAQMWKLANEIQARRTIMGAWKAPGQSWCSNMDGKVHTFLVRGKNNKERSLVDVKPELLLTPLKSGHFTSHLELVEM